MYTWQDGSNNSSYTVTDSGLYTVEIVNTCGSRTDSARVTKNCKCEVLVPTTFTPNNDLINDQFIANISCDLELYSMTIFNRWGEKVFESRQQKKGWDGTKNGRKLNSGTYFYVLNYKALNEGIQTVKGSILLTR